MENEPLRIQINDFDTYQTPPLGFDLQHQHVPVIRIFGSVSLTSGVHNILVHVHDAFPYLYVDCNIRDTTPTFLQEVTTLIESSLAESFQKRPPDDEELTESNQTYEPTNVRKYISSVQICKGTPVYGFHIGRLLFYKISLLSPVYKTRLARLLSENRIDLASLEKSKPSSRNVYEAHIPFVLQFLADFNLYGCSVMDISSFYFRVPLVSENVDDVTFAALKSHLIPLVNRNKVLDPDKYARIGKSPLEIDVTLDQIMNRKAISTRDIHHHFVELMQKSSLDEIYLSSLANVYKDLKYQCSLRNASQSVISLQNIHKASFGLGTTSWPNQGELSELLNYVITLNKPFPSSDVAEFYNLKIAKRVAASDQFPTCYDVIDEEINRHPQLDSDQFFSWNSYAELFAQHVFPTQQPVLTTSQIIANISDDSSLDESEEVPLEVLVETEHLDSRIMLQMTQRKRKNDSFIQRLEVPSSFRDSFSSINSSPSQALVDLPKHVYEVELLGLSRKEILSEFHESSVLKINYSDPFYSKKADVPRKALIFANKKIEVPYVKQLTALPISKCAISPQISEHLRKLRRKKIHSVQAFGLWEYTVPGPSKQSVKEWLAEEERSRKRRKFQSQIEPGLTLTNDYKFSYQSEKVERDPDAFIPLTNLYLEIHVNTNDDMMPNPETDPISMIFYKFDTVQSTEKTLGILVLAEDGLDLSRQLQKVNVFLNNSEPTKLEVFHTEQNMVDRLVDLVNFFDPDILSGYEINAASWGYIVERYRKVFDINLLYDFSRCTYKSNGKFGDRWGYTHTSVLNINGRHLINLWRVLRSEVNLTGYSLENVAYHLLHQNVPRYLNLQLSRWMQLGNFAAILTVLKYYQKRISLALKIIYNREVILRNVEQSRLIGIDFNSNFYRGSQFKVESILIRIAKLENLLLNSPSKQNVHDMRPIECIPLIMEPDSNLYKSPLVVLDFQSLYPSIMIAYNYCYTTLLGKLNGFKLSKNNTGYLKNLKLDSGLVGLLQAHDGVNVSPNGFMFAKSNVRKSMLAKMLEEILTTRINVKNMMKFFKDDPELIKLYNSRQLALKLIANVTYGYTSATFSGRMPNSDIADAIVSTGREILTKSIDMIEASNYGAKVVYGDTDSLFVYFPGKSKADAFKLGREIAKQITNEFPDPITLKFEKVYHPCVLLSKKRYVGYSFEDEQQKEPKFDAKGIETIRRDGIPAQLKMVEKCLRILFDTNDLSQVKHYVLTQFHKILTNRVVVKDFCFAKEVRHGTYKSEKHLPPGAVLANQKIAKDPRSEPQYRERVPYLVIRDSTKLRIKDRCVAPEDFIKSYSTDSPYSLDYEYYITRVLIPPLERIFNLLGADIKLWYKELPRYGNFQVQESDILQSNFIHYNSCLKCGCKMTHYTASKYICNDCLTNEQELVSEMLISSRQTENKLNFLQQSCRNCTEGLPRESADRCLNQDCTVYYRKIRLSNLAKVETKRIDLVLLDLQW